MIFIIYCILLFRIILKFQYHNHSISKLNKIFIVLDLYGIVMVASGHHNYHGDLLQLPV